MIHGELSSMNGALDSNRDTADESERPHYMKRMTEANVSLINRLVADARKEQHRSAGNETDSKANEASDSGGSQLAIIQQRTKSSEIVLKDDALNKLGMAITCSMNRITGVVNKLDRRLGRVFRDFEYAVPEIHRAKEAYNELVIALRQNIDDVSCAVLNQNLKLTRHFSVKASGRTPQHAKRFTAHSPHSTEHAGRYFPTGFRKRQEPT